MREFDDVFFYGQKLEPMDGETIKILLKDSYSD
uniref:Uncharacterized protein n=1 Tax=Lepeophtheirus salmonis TaxID=72036 RepID=A0A0K2ULU0_LEPSM